MICFCTQQKEYYTTPENLLMLGVSFITINVNYDKPNINSLFKNPTRSSEKKISKGKNEIIKNDEKEDGT